MQLDIMKIRPNKNQSQIFIHVVLRLCSEGANKEQNQLISKQPMTKKAVINLKLLEKISEKKL